jgi:hypothetical protein
MGIKKARVQALSEYWGRLQKEVMKTYEKAKLIPPKKTYGQPQKDTKLRFTFEKKLPDVPLEIKEHILKMYLEACAYKHALAFFQWR